MTNSLALFCLAAAVAAPLSAATMEEIKTVSDRPMMSLTVPKISDVCFGKGGLVAAVRESIAKAEKGVEGKSMNIGEGVDLVMQKAAADGGAQCVAKTILADAREKGDLASSITVEDNGKAISIMVATNGGPVLFKGSSESGAYAFQVLTYRLQRIAQPAATSGGSSCGQAGGKDEDQRGCQRHGFMRDAARELDILRLLPDPVPTRDARGGKDGDQMPSERRSDRHE